MLRAPMSGKAGMRPVPWRMIVAISSRESFVPMSTSDGIVGDALAIVSRWQLAQLVS